jgi:hypothetical protein
MVVVVARGDFLALDVAGSRVLKEGWLEKERKSNQIDREGQFGLVRISFFTWWYVEIMLFFFKSKS